MQEVYFIGSEESKWPNQFHFHALKIQGVPVAGYIQVAAWLSWHALVQGLSHEWQTVIPVFYFATGNRLSLLQPSRCLFVEPKPYDHAVANLFKRTMDKLVTSFSFFFLHYHAFFSSIFIFSNQQAIQKTFTSANLHHKKINLQRWQKLNNN